jgi:signal transduction histidine kinase
VRSRSRNNSPGTQLAEREQGAVGSAFGQAPAQPITMTGPDSRSEGPRPDDVLPQEPEVWGNRPGGRALRNWRVRSRLLLLITIPTLTAVALGGIRIGTSVQSALAYQRVLQLATLSSDISVLAQRLEDERDQTVYYIALGSKGGRGSSTAGPQLGVVRTQQHDADLAVTAVKTQLTRIGESFPGQTQAEASVALSELDALGALRGAATTTQLPALVVVRKYTDLIDDLLVLENATAQGASDPTLSQNVRVLGLVSHMKEQASQQRGILAAALIQHTMSPAELQSLTTAQSNQAADLLQFNLSATSAQRQLWNNSVSGAVADQAPSDEQQAIALQNDLSKDPTTADDWYGAMTHTIAYQMGSVERTLVSSITARAHALRNDAVTAALVIGAAVVLVLGLALLFTVVVARSMVRPLRKLRAGALEVAGVRLPETVRRMSEGESADASSEIEPIDVHSTDEIGEVARAFDQVHREAVRLASNEAALRGNVNAMFVNLSRRSQSLVERQIRLIDDLEQGEQDSERLSNLFQMDHLATRMRRNSENLLVLAGHEVSRRWTQSVALVDVLRAAVSEIEQYERVTLNVQPGIAVRGQAVNDVVHLLAELAENATSFSAADTPVSVSGHLLNSGGVLLDITDQGVGMGAEEMAHANWRLDNPPVVDVAVSRRMGLFVVARLAARHGIRVRLRPASVGGLTALVWLPEEVISHKTEAAPGGLRKFESQERAASEAGTPGLDEWPTVGQSDDRAAAIQAVAAARTPRFTPLRPDLGETAAFAAIGSDTSPDTTAVDTTAGSTPVPEREVAGAEDLDPGAVSPGVSGELASVYGAPVTSENQAFGLRADDAVMPSFGSEMAEAERGVVVPPALTAGEANRLPIFEAVESDWFRRGKHGTDHLGPEASAATGWAASPADEGWRAAEMAHAPVSGGTTVAGLPKRVPQANLVPGTALSGTPAPASAGRTAADIRQRLASFQRGIREGRAVSQDDEVTSGEEDSGS